MKPCPHTSLLLLALLFCLLLPSPGQAASAKWDPIPPEDLAAKECPWQPDAKAEHLFVFQTLKDQNREHHQRTKIYRADSETLGSILSITFTDDEVISDLHVRVVKPDGRVTEYARKDFREGLVLRTRNGKTMKLSASFGDIGDGDIVEMKWERATSLDERGVFWDYCQDTIPTRLYRVLMKTRDLSYTAQMFNIENMEITKPSSDQILMVAHKIPAFLDEPMSPPKRDLRGWYGLFFRNPYYAAYSGTDMWKELSKLWHAEFMDKTKPKAALKAKAVELVSGCTDPAEKLRRLYDYTRGNFHNFAYFMDASLTTLKKKRDGNDDWTCMDTFNSKCGYPEDITFLFAAMARALDFEVRLCRSTTRRSSTKVNHPNGYYFLSDVFVSVLTGTTWTLYAPGDRYVPPGMVHESNEHAPFLRCAPKSLDFGTNKASPASNSPTTRKGHFRLDEDGTLEGDVEICYGGHKAIEVQSESHGVEQEERDNSFKERFMASMPGAEIGDLTWKNLGTLESTVSVSFHLRIPGYSEVIGDRLTVIPGVFSRYEKPVFSSLTRTHDILFDYARTVTDDIQITLPKDYVLEAASAPSPVVTPLPILSAEYRLNFRAATGTLTYQRKFAQCKDGALGYKAAGYDVFRRLSEFIHKSDQHAIICRQSPSSLNTHTTP